MNLLPCPFCASTVVTVDMPFVGPKNTVIQCMKCLSSTNQENWNTRPGERAAAERMRAACANLVENMRSSYTSASERADAVRAIDIDRVLEDSREKA